MKTTKRLTTEEFILRSKKVFGENKYDYSQTVYVNNFTKVKLIYEGVVYEQMPQNHIKGFKCENIKNLTQEEFIKKSKEIHGNKYDYSLVEFKNVRGKIKLIYEGIIYEQFAYANLQGKSPEMLSVVRESKGSIKISNFLDKNNIEYVKEHSYNDCKNISILRFDFYLPKYNILIEYDGRQHFEPVDIWGGYKSLKTLQNNDKIKNEYCKKNRIPLLRISYLEDVDIKLNDYLASYLKL